MKTLIPSTITKVTTMRDRSLRVQVDTQETTKEQAAELMGLFDLYGYFFFSESLEMPDTKNLPEVVIDKDEKSPAQVLRSVLFRFWEKKGKQGTFELFYRSQMEILINHFKSKLN